MATQSTGFFTVETGTAVIAVRLRVFLANPENAPYQTRVDVVKRRNGQVYEVVSEEVTIPAGATRVIEIDDVAGEDVQVTVDLPEREYPPQSPVVPGVAVISAFAPDDEVTLLHWISASDFAPVS